MRMILAAAVAASAMVLSACGETQANTASGYTPTESEVLAYEGATLFGDLYAAEADTFTTWATVIDGERHMFAAGRREDGSIMLLSVHGDGTSSLQNLTVEQWADYANVLGIPSGE